MSASGQVEGADRLARVALNLLAEPGHPVLSRTVRRFGPARTIELLRGSAAGTTERELAERLARLEPDQVLAHAGRRGIRFVVPGDVEWPDQLNDLVLAGEVNGQGGVPVGLWVSGPAELSGLAPAVAVVGSRSSTSYGERVGEEIAATLAQHQVCVISGGAFGIDVAAHRGALGMGGATVAVLACGVDRDYPQAHTALLQHLRRTYAVVSEVPPGGAPLAHRFLARNRLIAALTSGTVVVEAARRSGALNTANWARRVNRCLMGVPGPVTSVTSVGVHHLLREGVAQLVTNGADVLELVSPTGEHLTGASQDETGRAHLSSRYA